LDTPLLHQGFCLRLNFDGLSRLAAFDPHGGLHGLYDFPVEAGSRLHSSSKTNPPV
jgi:hypothetical protein